MLANVSTQQSIGSVALTAKKKLLESAIPANMLYQAKKAAINPNEPPATPICAAVVASET